jgi:archaellum component FlaG (FlaF/FlaG flagellin family)
LPLTIDAASIRIITDGAFSGPAYTFVSDPVMGMYRAGVKILAFTPGQYSGIIFFDNPTNYQPRIILRTYGTASTALSPSIRVDAQNTTTLLPLTIDAASIRMITDGLVSSPAYTFVSDPAMGIYRGGTNLLGISVGSSSTKFTFDIPTIYQPRFTLQNSTSTVGAYTPIIRTLSSVNVVQPIIFDVTQIKMNVDGTIYLPAYSFVNDPEMGMYRMSAGKLGLQVALYTAYYFDNIASSHPRFTIRNGTSSVNVLNPTIRAENRDGVLTGLNIDATALNVDTINATLLRLANGTAVAPSYSFTNSTAAGMWYDSTGPSTVINAPANTMRVRTGPTAVLSLEMSGNNVANIMAYKNYATTSVLGSLAFNANQVISGMDGTSAIPMFTFANALGIGMFRLSGNILGFTVGDAELLLQNITNRAQINLRGNYAATTGTNYNVIRSEGSDAVLQDTFFDTNQLLATDGTSTEPAYSFLNDKTMGFRRVAANNLGAILATGAQIHFIDGGTYKARLNLKVFSVTAAGTDYNIIGSYDSTATPVQQGLWLDTNLVDIRAAAGVLKINGTQVVGIRQAAVADVTGTADATYSANEVTMINSLQTQLNDLMAKLRTHGLITP